MLVQQRWLNPERINAMYAIAWGHGWMASHKTIGERGGTAAEWPGARQQAASAAVRAAPHQVPHRVQAAWCNLTGCCPKG